ncbi:hypothetical protein [Tardiphaga alba]|nr:hypothetical protein [Tardiphaga alba]
MGVITLDGGRLTGSDASISYRGSYIQEGDAFTADIQTSRHADGPPSIFGIDELDIQVVGTSKARTASCRGTVKQRPNIPFEVVLVRISS